MSIASQVQSLFKPKNNLPIAQRLSLGFLIAALIAGLLAGGTGLLRIQALHQQSDFYQQLLQAKTTLSNGNDLLTIMDIQTHEIIAQPKDKDASVETMNDDEANLRNLINKYETLLTEYANKDLLIEHPEQIALLNAAHQNTRVTTQAALAQSAQRTWKYFRQAQLEILKEIVPGHTTDQDIANATSEERLVGEPSFSDTQSAIVALIRFNETTAQSVHNAVIVEETNQIVTTIIGIVLAIVSIILVGLFISSTVVHRLKQIRSITKAVELGDVTDRIHVRGHDEIAEISSSVNAMLEIIASEQAIVTASELKDQFIASVSHELHNPLTNVFGWLEILANYNDDIDDDTRLRFLQKAMNGCQDLMQLVNNVLEATRIKQGMMTLGTAQIESIQLNPLIASVLDSIDPGMIEQYSLRTDLAEDIFVLADEQYVRQVLRNLISNAFKYSPKKSTITISNIQSSPQATDISATNAQKVCICVQDTGPGIPPAEIPHLFQKFARLPRDKNIHGTGLGLYICKQLVEVMGGCIWVESSGIAGEGSRFYFTLPIPQSLQIADVPPATISSGIKDLSEIK